MNCGFLWKYKLMKYFTIKTDTVWIVPSQIVGYEAV